MALNYVVLNDIMINNRRGLWYGEKGQPRQLRHD